MLAFLGAVICIIASVYPAGGSRGGGGGHPDNVSSPGGHDASAAALLPGADKTLGALHGHGAGGGGGGSPDALLDLLASARPRQEQHQQLFSRFLCTPLASECPSEGGPQGDGPGLPASASEELFFLQSTAEQLRQTARQQKEQIRTDQETIRELTTKLSRCENGLERGFQDDDGGAMRDLPWDSPALVRELEEAVRALKGRIDKIEQDIPTRVNASSTAAPVAQQEAVHSKMEELEEQLLTKLLALEKERSSIVNNHDQEQQQQHEVEKELDALQNRVSELEHETPTSFNPPGAFKISIPVRNNYMYGRIKKSLPELYAFTVCLWLKAKGPGAVGTPFSYSVPGQSNELVLLVWGHNPMELIINDKVALLPMTLKDGTWHHICINWITRDGIWSAYQDGEERGASENLASWHPVKPHGVLILGQEQDTLGGRFDATQAFVGEISQFNLWDRVLTPAEIVGLANCTNHLQGNIIQWDEKTVEVHGGATKQRFEICEEKMKA
nr:neuronal pentraxin receptor isoform X1 [Anolis sagrei ordinatus]